MLRALPCAVLDSNIWVDILIFDDPHTRPIRDALQAGRLHAIIDANCREELKRVLAYPRFARFALDEHAALEWVDAHTTRPTPKPDAALSTRPLPRCKDPDDQKFLELANQARVQYLVSKDRAVLKLKRRMERDFQIQVLLPQAFVDAVLLPAEGLAP